MNTLSERLKIIADNIEKGEAMADIGTDHGFLPLFLICEKICPKVIMADVSRGSLDKARANFVMAGFSEEAGDFRLGSGLRVLEKGEVDTVVMAGMGGRLMIELLQEDFEKTCSFRKFILQPRNGQGDLRHFLAKRGFTIQRELLTDEEGRLCNIIVALPPKTAGEDPFGGKALWFKRYEPEPEEEYPLALLRENPELGRRLFEMRIAHYENILTGIKIHGDSKSKARMPVIQKKIRHLKEGLKNNGMQD